MMAQTTPNHTQTVSGWAAHDTSGKITPFTFKRRENGTDDVTIKILYCGICHTDLHHVKNDWGITMYPVVPGHEIVGIVTKVGNNVGNFKVGDQAGVGCLAATCLKCEYCKEGQENYCDQVQFVYNGIFWDGSITYGGYSEFLVVDHRYVVRVPDNLPMDTAAPLLCAGITVFSPLKDNNLLELTGKRIGIVGLGGLGHVAVKFGKAFGHHVTIISTSPSKEKEAKEHLGADDFILSTNPEQMQSKRRTLDFILDTVSGQHSLGPTLELLKVNGTLVIVGAPDKPIDLPSFPLIFGKRVVKGSMIGSIKETQDMMDVCGKHNITCDIEVVKTDQINEALDRLAKNDVKYRFVIDIAGHQGEKENRSSHKGNPSVAEEYNEAFRTKSYTELFNKVQDQLETCPDKGHSFSSSSPPTPMMSSHLSEYLLEPPQETVTSILNRSNPHGFLVNYFDTSQEAGKICEFVLANVHQIGHNYRSIKKITNLTEQFPDPTRWTHNQYDALYKNLALFAMRNNPFSLTPEKFVEIHDTHVQLLQQLTLKYKKTKKRTKFIKYIKRGLSAILMVGSGAAAITFLVLAAHSMVGMVAAPGLIMCCLGFLMMKRKLKGRKRKSKKTGLEGQLDVAARGVYTLINDFDTMGQLVKGLYSEMERRKLVAGTVVERRKNGMLQEVVRDFKMHESGFLEQVEELKSHIYLCFLNINRARRLLVQEIV